jgi:hypothetical protein
MRQMLQLYSAPRPFFICFGCGKRGPFAANEDGSYTLCSPS